MFTVNNCFLIWYMDIAFDTNKITFFLQTGRQNKGFHMLMYTIGMNFLVMFRPKCGIIICVNCPHFLFGAGRYYFQTID